jgi:hypothetical protein
VKGDAGIRLAGYIVCTLIQCVDKDDDVLGGGLNLIKGQGGRKVELLCKSVKDPLVENVRYRIFSWSSLAKGTPRKADSELEVQEI